MTLKFCSGCMRQRPAEQIKRKKLKNGGIRLICFECIERIKTRKNFVFF